MALSSISRGPGLLAAALLATALLTPPASAQETATTLKRVEDSLKQNKPGDAYDAAEDLSMQIWQRMPLGFRRQAFVSGDPAGYGLFNPRENTVFDGKTPLIVYVEPVGFGWLKRGDIWKTEMVLDFAVKSKAGAELYKKEAFQTLSTESRSRVREHHVALTYTIRGLDPGDYVLVTTMRDTATGKRGSFELPFSIK